MGSSKPDRSISSGIPLPQWMKSKIGDRYDLDETFSPPSYDDSFFYIRYRKTDQRTEVAERSEPSAKPDFSQHTAQCRQFIPDTGMGTAEPSGSIVKVIRSMKPVGTDDSFTGDTAACGKSVVDVAHQMIASNMLVRGLSESPATGDGFNRNKRRGSKSLPSSPSTSPQTRRRIQNRYFTGAFTLERANTHPAGHAYAGSWILSGLLGQQREHLSDSQDSISILEEEEAPRLHEMRRNKSMTSIVTKMFSEGSRDDEVEVGVDVVTTSVSGMDSPTQKKAFRAKPSELREMNFWSPTSM